MAFLQKLVLTLSFSMSSDRFNQISCLHLVNKIAGRGR